MIRPTSWLKSHNSRFTCIWNIITAILVCLMTWTKFLKPIHQALHQIRCVLFLMWELSAPGCRSLKKGRKESGREKMVGVTRERTRLCFHPGATCTIAPCTIHHAPMHYALCTMHHALLGQLAPRATCRSAIWNKLGGTATASVHFLGPRFFSWSFPT